MMMVVVGGAGAVEGLAGIVVERIDRAGFRHLLQRAVHGGQADLVALGYELLVDVLGTAERGEAFQ